MDDATARDRAADHLRAIASEPRPAGSPAVRRAREYCAGVLSDAGFSVGYAPFSYSAFPGRWATPLAGAGLLTMVLAARFLAAGGAPALATLAVAAASVFWIVAGLWLARIGVLAMPVLRAEGLNLEAVRGAPTVWLVAHIDSKSQPVPSLLRVVAGLVLIVATLVALGLAIAEWAGAAHHEAAWRATAGTAILGAVPVMLSVVGARSAGALDNASGVATVLLAAESLPRDWNVGVLITDAEELGMAGARAWARGRRPAVALNCDGVDDVGMLTVMFSGLRPASLVQTLESASRDMDAPIRVRRLIPGILTDSVALADAGWETVTLSRGTARTLARVHSVRDDLRALEGTGIPATARVVAAAVVRLGDQPRER